MFLYYSYNSKNVGIILSGLYSVILLEVHVGQCVGDGWDRCHASDDLYQLHYRVNSHAKMSEISAI